VRRIEAFRTTHRFSPDEVLAKCFAFDEQLGKSKDETELSECAAREARATLDFSLRGWVKALRLLGLAEDCNGGVGNMLAVLQNGRSEEHTSELQSLTNLVCRLLLEKKKKRKYQKSHQYEDTIQQR